MPLPSFSQEIALKNIYTVQVYSSNDLNTSKEFAQKFHSFGQPFIFPILINQVKWFRVYLGTYNSIRNAKEIKNKVQIEMDIKDAIVVKLISAD
jgi:septal ring-binding cell division protein DamX